MLSSVFRTREGFSRSITILLIVALQFYSTTVEYKTDYLFTRRVFHWDMVYYTKISTGDQGDFLKKSIHDNFM